jgi:hypothetical protein
MIHDGKYVSNCRGRPNACETIRRNYSLSLAMPKSPANAGVLARIHRLKTLTIEIRAGNNAIRRYPAVKANQCHYTFARWSLSVTASVC